MQAFPLDQPAAARLGARVECSCVDFAKSKSACKHLVYILLHVLELPEDPCGGGAGTMLRAMPLAVG